MDCISEENRAHFILKIIDAANLDPIKQWRMILFVAQNIGSFCHSFKLEEVEETFMPIFLKLSHERIAEIRKNAAQNFSKIIQRFSASEKCEKICQ